MHKKRIIIQAHYASCCQFSDCPGRPGRDYDRLECNTLKFFHRLVKCKTSAKKCADHAGTAAEYRDIQVACAVNDILGAASDQCEELYHFLDALAKESCLGIVVNSADLAVALLRKSNCQGYAERISVLHRHCTLYADDICGEADVIVICCQKSLDLLKSFHIFSAESDMAVIVVRKLIAGAGTADRVEIDVLAGRLTLLEDSRIGNQRAVLEVDHTLSDCEERNLFGKYRKDLIAEPVETETADAAQDQICAFECFLQLFDLIILNPVMKSSLQCDVIIIFSESVNDLPVQGGSDEPDFMEPEM